MSSSLWSDQRLANRRFEPTVTQTSPTPKRYKLYKSDISYFSGKLEAYLRYKEISYQPIDVDFKALHRIDQCTGTKKMPAIEMLDDRWLYDTTPSIQWLESEHAGLSIYPDDRALRFVALLLEDYADEWLWRPAMWWRWVPAVSRVALGRKIVGTTLSKWLAVPLGFYFGKRQLREWLWNDGVDKQNSDAVRDMYYHELDFLQALLSRQAYLLGDRPSAADFGYFGPMFRHFGNDPDSSEVMRRRGPNTYEWLARLWNTRQSNISDSAKWTWPDACYWQPLLKRIANDYLPYLHQNALAFAAGKKRFDYTGESLSFKSTVTTHYRVWCRENLQEEYGLLNDNEKDRLNSLFDDAGGLGSLHADGLIASGLNEQFVLPVSPRTSKPPFSIRRILMGQPRN